MKKKEIYTGETFPGSSQHLWQLWAYLLRDFKGMLFRDFDTFFMFHTQLRNSQTRLQVK